MFTLPFGDAAIVAAILSAQSVLSSNGAVSFLGPTPTTSGVALQSSNTTSSQIDTLARTYVTTLLTAGSALLQVGDIGTCTGFVETSGTTGNPLGCAPATFETRVLDGRPFPTSTFNLRLFHTERNFDVATHEAFRRDITSTTTNSYITTEVYEIQGLLATTAVPEPGTLVLSALGLFALGFSRCAGRK